MEVDSAVVLSWLSQPPRPELDQELQALRQRLGIEGLQEGDGWLVAAPRRRRAAAVNAGENNFFKV